MNKTRSLLLAFLFTLVTIGPAAAIPKAAENEAAAVTYGADAPKPKKTKATNSNPTEKKRAAKAKTVHKAKHGKARGR